VNTVPAFIIYIKRTDFVVS